MEQATAASKQRVLGISKHQLHFDGKTTQILTLGGGACLSTFQIASLCEMNKASCFRKQVKRWSQGDRKDRLSSSEVQLVFVDGNEEVLREVQSTRNLDSEWMVSLSGLRALVQRSGLRSPDRAASLGRLHNALFEVVNPGKSLPELAMPAPSGAKTKKKAKPATIDAKPSQKEDGRQVSSTQAEQSQLANDEPSLKDSPGSPPPNTEEAYPKIKALFEGDQEEEGNVKEEGEAAAEASPTDGNGRPLPPASEVRPFWEEVPTHIKEEQKRQLEKEDPFAMIERALVLCERAGRAALDETVSSRIQHAIAETLEKSQQDTLYTREELDLVQSQKPSLDLSLTSPEEFSQTAAPANPGDSYKSRRSWADQFNKAIQRVIGEVFVQIAPVLQDQRRATDFVFSGEKTFGARVRQAGVAKRYPWHLTLRTSGKYSEFQKVLGGQGPEYIVYGHEDPNKPGELARWMVVNARALSLVVRRKDLAPGLRCGMECPKGRGKRSREGFWWVDLGTCLDENVVVATSHPEELSQAMKAHAEKMSRRR